MLHLLTLVTVTQVFYHWVMKVTLYTMQALAEKLETSYGYMRQQMLKIKKGELATWKGFKFLAVGEGKRSTWIAYPENIDIELIHASSEQHVKMGAVDV